LFTATGPSGETQPITIAPSIMLHPNSAMPGFMILFGTGRYLGTDDLSNTDGQTIYGVWDYGDAEDEYLGTFMRGGTPQLSNLPDTASLLEQTQIFYDELDFGTFTRYLRVLSNNPIVWSVESDDDVGERVNPSSTEANHVGWYFDLYLSETHFKERVVHAGQVRQGKYIIITSIPKSDLCSAGGDSIVHEIDAATGGRTATAQFDIDLDAAITAGDLIEIDNPAYDPSDPNQQNTDPDAPNYVPVRITVAPTGIHFPSMMYPPVILRMPDDQTEMKYFSTAAGNIALLQEVAEQRGLYYWRQR
jgi:type IV pilus assembly protein PilY1